MFESQPEIGVLPSFAQNWEQGSRTAVLMPVDDLDAIVRKWVQGVHYNTLGRIIPDASAIDVFHVDECAGDAPPLIEILKRSPTHHRGPGIKITQASGSDETKIMTLYRFLIWQQFIVYASVREQASP
ncbi:MAG: hypothetical protein U1E42_07640 [Rhodospirillales bacterium]